jgi:glycyl-tRNA synthetase (class II)
VDRKGKRQKTKKEKRMTPRISIAFANKLKLPIRLKSLMIKTEESIRSPAEVITSIGSAFARLDSMGIHMAAIVTVDPNYCQTESVLKKHKGKTEETRGRISGC